MLLSLALILLVSLLLSSLFIKLHIPSLIAMIFTGIILGPYVLNLISPNLLSISADLREIALIVILLRAGLSLDLKDLKKVGRPAILLSFLPATIEILAIGFLAPIFFNINLIDALLMGSIVAAVSPAIVVPKMIHLIESRQGTNKSIPQMVLAGASIDDIYVIVLFTSFLQISQGGTIGFSTLLSLPISLLLGLIVGVSSGLLLIFIFKKFHIRDTVKVFIIFSFAFLLMFLEDSIKEYVPFSGLLGIMALGGTILKQYPVLAKRLTVKFSKIWIGAEIMLFVLVGAIVDIRVLSNIGVLALLLILLSLCMRMIAVQIACIKTNLTLKEKIYVSFSYIPKATVQAAIGAIPLSLGLSSGNLILTVAVLSILFTAPLGAILMDRTSKQLLFTEPQ
ncbi:MAG: cation:proton antiporter [Firmicutes bacterium]|nr:cation:proton antiporter [Bacillota bacterium]